MWIGILVVLGVTAALLCTGFALVQTILWARRDRGLAARYAAADIADGSGAGGLLELVRDWLGEKIDAFAEGDAGSACWDGDSDHCGDGDGDGD